MQEKKEAVTGKGFLRGRGECFSVREREAGRLQSNRFLYLAGIKGVSVWVRAGWDYTQNGVRMRRERSVCDCVVGNKKIFCFSVLITWGLFE